MSDSWLISVEPDSEEPVPTGVCTFVNALAFSTLLSSQETDAHLRRNFRSLPGQPLNLTLEFLSCQLRFRKLSRRLRSRRGGLSRHQRSAPSACGRRIQQAQRVRARPSEVETLVAPRVPARLPAFRPPRGKMNFTAGANRRQIGSCTPLTDRF